jgi:hypothetical protein
MATFQQYEPGLGSVGNYQVSGVPWITASVLPPSGNTNGLNTSTHHIKFPYVTKSFTVCNVGQTDIDVRLANDQGSIGIVNQGSHAFEIPMSGTADSNRRAQFVFDAKVKEIFISNRQSAVGGFQIFASCTRIDRKHMFELTGSGVNSVPGDTTITP